MSKAQIQAVNFASQAMSFDILNYVRLPIFVLQIDAAQRPVYAAYNDCACEVAGLTADQVIGRTAIEIYGGRLGELAYARHLQATWSGQPLSYELTLPLHNHERTVRTTLEPVLDQAGEVAYLFGTSADISHEQGLRESNAEAETLARETEAIFDAAAHDLRTPMRQISEVVDTLRIDFLDHKDGKLDLINKLGEIALNAQTLITDMLSQDEGASLAHTDAIVQLEELCAKILVMLDPMESHQAHVDPVAVQVDQTSLQIVLRTLIDHLFQASAGERKLISVTVEKAGLGMLEFIVRDYGSGFGAAAHHILSGQAEHRHIRLGLHGVRRLIKARSGAIAIHRPEDGPGDLVKFTLPGKIVSR